jgi:hypothetical protein
VVNFLHFSKPKNTINCQKEPDTSLKKKGRERTPTKLHIKGAREGSTSVTKTTVIKLVKLQSLFFVILEFELYIK